MIKNTIALISGLIFGLGLNISQMTDPQKVLNFLNVVDHWDPSLLLVMGSALVVSALGYLFAKRLTKPICAQQFNLPESKVVTKPLVIGATLFGIGWGLAGLCPGPAIASLAHPSEQLLYFLASMFMGSFIARKIS